MMPQFIRAILLAVALVWAELPAHSARATEPVGIFNEFDPTVFRVVPGLPEPLVATGATSIEENAALDEAQAEFRTPLRAGGDFAAAIAPFASFMSAHPRSAWNAALLVNLGAGYYRAGYFSRAKVAFRSAWESAQHASDPRAVALAQRALGEYAVMLSRAGEHDELQRVVLISEGQSLRGPATDLIAGARESLWMFENEPGVSFMCGPYALKNLMRALGSAESRFSQLEGVASRPSGFSLFEVSDLASKAGISHRLVFRRPGQAVPVPSIVNWKVQHYAAIVREENGRFLVKDPTFGTGDFWVSQAAIDDEASGYFLVPETTHSAQAGEWRVAESTEARSVFGKGFTPKNDPNAYTPDDKMLHEQCGDRGMCVANAAMMLVSLRLTDTPVGYRPQKGPSVMVRLTYNQREGSFPANFAYFNLGPKWNINLLSYVQDDASAEIFAESLFFRHVLGGGVTAIFGRPYTNGFFPTTEPRTGNRLKRVPAFGPLDHFEVHAPDGSILYYEKSDGAVRGIRRVFLTRVADSAGNELKLAYDADLRLVSVTDATGRVTKLEYKLGARTIAAIVDPFGRRAQLQYGDIGQLVSITDAIGMQTKFDWGAYPKADNPGIEPWKDPSGYGPVATPAFGVGWSPGSGTCTNCQYAVPPWGNLARTEYLIRSMTTPYGTTRFDFGWDSKKNYRYLSITDPLNQTERIEFLHRAPGIAFSDPLGSPLSQVPNEYLDYRNTFRWDKHSYAMAGGDYSKAQVTHWYHLDGQTTSGNVESIKEPLENRKWFFYDGKPTPVRIGQIMHDGTARVLTRDSYSNGKIRRIVDGVGRNLLYEYTPSDINSPTDLISVSAADSQGPLRLATFTYNDQHRPVTFTDASNQTTKYGYNSAGQLTSTTNALGDVTTYVYDDLGRLQSIVNANGALHLQLSYDEFDRVRTATDSEGYSLTYSYDTLDRLLEVKYPDGTTSRVTYDKLDIATRTDREGRTTTYTHDGVRQLTAVVDPLLRKTEYSYYGTGVLKSIKDAKGNVTQWLVDIQSRPTAKVYADGTKESYAYDPATGNLASVTDARGVTKSYSYYKDDRLAGIVYSPATTPAVSFTYDAVFPRLTSMTDGIGLTQFTYVPLGIPGANRLQIDDGPYGNDEVKYVYDELGRVKSRTVGGVPETYQYDNIGRLIKNVNEIGAFDIAYLGQTRQVVSSKTSTVGSYWSYLDNEGDRRLSEIRHLGQGRGFRYVTTPQNRIASMQEGVSENTFSQAWTYTYDAANRLTSAVAFSGLSYKYSYDSNDNIALINGQSAIYNNLDQLQVWNGRPYSYDAAGNLTDDGARHYFWDAENRLVRIVYGGQADRDSVFRYDGLGRRLAIVERATAGLFETRFAWCGSLICHARSATDENKGAFYLQGISLQGQTPLYFARDHLGSVRDLLEASSGALVSSYDFDPYGVVSKPGLPVDFGYAGMFIHQSSGLGLTRFRAYEAPSARWLSRDPIAYPPGKSLYAYVSGRPTTTRDPLGLVGIGFTAGYGAEAGLLAGISAQVSVGGVSFYDSQIGEVSVLDAFSATLFGGVTGGTTVPPTYPSPEDMVCDPSGAYTRTWLALVMGLSMGVNYGMVLTSANNATELAGFSPEVYSLSTPLINIQYSTGSASTVTITWGPSIGGSVSVGQGTTAVWPNRD